VGPADRPAAERPAAERPAAERPAAEAPAARQGGAAETLSDVQSDQPTTGEVDGPAIAMVAGSAGAAVSQLKPQPQPQPVLPAVAAPVARQYRVDMPPSAAITLDVARTDADGAMWSGEAVMSWQLQGDRYRMRVEAGVRVLVARINLVVVQSEGKVNEYGFAPVTMTEKRRGRAPTTTQFSERDGRITFSAAPGFTPAPVALLPGAQDKATLPLQLAAIARAGSGQIEAGIELLVGDERDASLYRFVVLGQEVLDTRLGKLQAWHLSRPPKPGAYSSRLDIWLAPGQGWYPVQIRNTEASGAVTTQTANKIVITDAGS
ncbi:MAG: hypothetical protein JWR40_676, partial [Massilia sp.]|nr:hypothetical protein [Massilia sp.]